MNAVREQREHTSQQSKTVVSSALENSASKCKAPSHAEDVFMGVISPKLLLGEGSLVITWKRHKMTFMLPVRIASGPRLHHCRKQLRNYSNRTLQRGTKDVCPCAASCNQRTVQQSPCKIQVALALHHSTCRVHWSTRIPSLLTENLVCSSGQYRERELIRVLPKDDEWCLCNSHRNSWEDSFTGLRFHQEHDALHKM